MIQNLGRNCSETLSQVSKIQLTTCAAIYLLKESINQKNKSSTCICWRKPKHQNQLHAGTVCLLTHQLKTICRSLEVCGFTRHYFIVSVFTVCSTCMLNNIAVICFRELLEPCFIPNKCTMQWWATSFVIYMYMYLKS